MENSKKKYAYAQNQRTAAEISEVHYQEGVLVEFVNHRTFSRKDGWMEISNLLNKHVAEHELVVIEKRQNMVRATKDKKLESVMIDNIFKGHDT